jgi:hypothetical protein
MGANGGTKKQRGVTGRNQREKDVKDAKEIEEVEAANRRKSRLERRRGDGKCLPRPHLI